MSVTPFPKGTWEHTQNEQRVFEAGYNRVVGQEEPIRRGSGSIDKRIVAVALAGFALLLAGGLLFHFQVNTIASYSSLGVGAALSTGAIVGKIITHIRHQDLTTIKDVTYTIVSWNIGTQGDFAYMCDLHKKMTIEGKSYEAAFQERPRMWPKERRLTPEEQKERVQLFQQTFTQMNRPDIICLQESYELASDELQRILPPGYAFFSYQNRQDQGRWKYRNCTVVWNTEKFFKVQHAALNYGETVKRNPNTMALLQDKTNGMTVCVTSAHLKGLSLAKAGPEKEHEARLGDGQASYDLETMDEKEADLYIYAGDFNVTYKHYPQRLALIQSYDYIADRTDESPTIHDACLKEADGVTPQAVRLDHIFVRTRDASKSLEVRGMPAPCPLRTFYRPSDHLPIGARIQLVGS